MAIKLFTYAPALPPPIAIEKSRQAERIQARCVSICLSHTALEETLGIDGKSLHGLDPWARELKRKGPKLGKISFVASLDVLYDIAGEFLIFSHVHRRG
jgi:hypothetical protein